MTADLLDQVSSPAEASEVRRMLTGLTERDLDEQIDYTMHTTPREALPIGGDQMLLLEVLASVTWRIRHPIIAWRHWQVMRDVERRFGL